MPRPAGLTDHQVNSVRRFSRFCARRLGLLRPHPPVSELSPPQARVLLEVAASAPANSTALARDLALDPGYLSRLLSGLERRGLLSRRRSEQDARRRQLRLTAAGEEIFAALQRDSRAQVEALLGPLSQPARTDVVAAMARIRAALGDADGATAAAHPVRLRRPQPGDLGWVIARHGEIYHREFGWEPCFEALVARIAADFLERHDPDDERGWIAERDGERVGCAFLVRAGERTAKLRMVLVEPAARGNGLGRRLVRECIAFARSRGYRRIMLWTVDALSAARRIYESEGFVLESSTPHREFAIGLNDEHWSLALD